MKILMVCIGNICRSPIAEGVLQHLSDEKGLDWEVASAAVMPYHIGSPPHDSSTRVCLENGIDISNQKAALFTVGDLEKYDYIYVMADDVYAHILDQVDGDESRLSNVDLFRNITQPGAQLNVKDPWYGGWQDYVDVYEMVYENCQAFIDQHA